MVAFKNSPRLADDFVKGWRNEAWVASPEYLTACVESALKTQGSIVECGSGLTTIVMGIIAAKRNLAYIALESDYEWFSSVREKVERLKLSNVRLFHTPIKDYRDFSWYDLSNISIPDDVSLVVCDGPPSTTRGGRYGMLPMLKKFLTKECQVLLDDAQREGEQETIRLWSEEFGCSCVVDEASKPFARISLKADELRV